MAALIFMAAIGLLVSLTAVLFALDWQNLRADKRNLRALRKPQDNAMIGFEVTPTEQTKEETI